MVRLNRHRLVSWGINAEKDNLTQDERRRNHITSALLLKETARQQ